MSTQKLSHTPSAARASSIQVGFPAKFKLINRGADYSLAGKFLRSVKHAAATIDNSQPATYNVYHSITSSLASSRLEKQQCISSDNAQLEHRCARAASVSQCKKNSLSAFVNPPLSDPRLPFSTARTLDRSSSARACRPSHEADAAAARHAASSAASGGKSSARTRPASAGCTAPAAKPILSDRALDRVRSSGHVHAWAGASNAFALAQIDGSAKLQRLWQQHQRQLQLQEQQRERVQGQLLQFNDAQKKKDVDRLRPGLQLDARYAAVISAVKKQKQPPPAADACPVLYGANAELQDKLLDAIMQGAAFDDDDAAAAASDAVRAHLRKHSNLSAARVSKVAASILDALGLKGAAAAVQQQHNSTVISSSAISSA